MAINSLSSASKGMSGLVSGMDTQSMVDAMLAGTQAKIDKQKANKTILGYKRDIYRNTLTDLKNFQNNFFKFSSKTGTNMLSTDFYNSLSALNKSSAFKVTAGSSALAGKTTINSIEQLAQSLKLKSTLDKTTADVKGTLDISQIKEGSEIQMVLDGVSKMIKLPQGAASDAEFVAQLNASIQQTFGNGVAASLDGGIISFNAADSSREFKISGNLDAMGALGLKSGVSNKMSLYMSLGDINFAQPLSGSSFKFNINGVDFEVTENDSLNTVISKINSSNANVKVRYSAIEDKFSIESTISGKGTKIEMSQSEGNLLTALFGEGSSGSIVGKKLYSYGDITAKLPGVPENVGTPPTADEQKLIDEAIAVLNSNVDRFATASVGEFVLRVDGKDIKIKLPPREKDPADATKELPYTMEHMIKAINEDAELDAKGIKLSLDIQNGNFTGGVTMTANEGVHIEGGSAFAAIGLSVKTTNEKTATEDATLASMGIAGPLTVKIGAETLSFTANQTLSEVTAAMESKLKEQATAAGQTAEQVGAIKVEVIKAPPGSEGKIRLFGVDIPVDIQIGGDGNKLFGTDKLTLNSGGKALTTVTEGKNAVAYINGERVERNSNEFTVEGLSFELKETFYESYGTEKANAADPNTFVGDTSKFENIDTSRNNDQVFDGIVKFMDEYNKIVDKVWGMLKEDANYKDYPPLTDKQKEAMSEKEIELWEKKSQEGLMRGDDTMEAIMDSMRRVLNQRPAGSKYSLAEMGITTGYDMETGIGGKLIFNDAAGSGEKLREMIAQEPEELEKLFANSETGLLVELNNVLEAAVTPPKEGTKHAALSLVALAGKSGMPDTFSKIYLETKEIDKNLENLKRKYEAEHKRYWKQFNAMEQMIQQMNSQSSWLTQQLG